jgi:hypothetical protein
LNISVEASSNWGFDWDLTCSSVTGDVGPGIAPGMGKEIVWDLASDYPGFYSDIALVRIIANDGFALYAQILRGESDPFNPQDPEVYPFWERWLPDGTYLKQTFSEGDTVPHRARVVFKVLGWEGTAKREVSRGRQALEFQARYQAVGQYQGHSEFPFSTLYSDPHQTPEWNTPVGSSDTLSFLAGPFAYHLGFRVSDGGYVEPTSYDTISFYGNFKPVVQNVEPRSETMPTNDYSGFYGTHPSIANVDTLCCSLSSLPIPGHPDWIPIVPYDFTSAIWFKIATGQVWLERPENTVGVDSVVAVHFSYILDLFGEDHPQELLFQPSPPAPEKQVWDFVDRIFSWNYEISSERDPQNRIRDGYGIDDITGTTYEFEVYPDYPISIDDEGVWHLRILVGVPFHLFIGGIASYLDFLQQEFPFFSQTVLELTTGQFGLTTAQLIARDSSIHEYHPDHCAYVCFANVRVPEDHGESCVGYYPGALYTLPLDDFSIPSDPVVKRYVIKMYAQTGEIFP